jgi:hypothetical protein
MGEGNHTAHSAKIIENLLTRAGYYRLMWAPLPRKCPFGCTVSQSASKAT